MENATRLMNELEQATQIVLAPPNVVTSEQRHCAEAVILQFRKTKLPYQTCRIILENSKCDYVLFQAATTIKESIIREWSLLSSEDIESLRSFLLRFITQNISLQSYVREQILQTVAVILKRGTLDLKGASCDSLFQDVTQLIASGNVTMQLVACSMLTALLNEYSSSSRTSSVGFTWEFHARCKRTFEEKELKRVFLFAFQVLHQIEQQPSPLTREATAVLNRFLSISEHILCWEFTPKSPHRKRVGVFESHQNVTLKPHNCWRETLLDKSLINLLFKIHKKARHNSEMSHHSLTCLQQMASLNGPVFESDATRSEYLSTFIEGFLQMLASIDLQEYESLGVANTFSNLVVMFPQPCFESIPKSLLDGFIDHMTKLTCSFGRAAAREEATHKDETLQMEALQKMLETWMDLISNSKSLPADCLTTQCVEVFNTFVQCHISAPDGIRSMNCNGSSHGSEEEVDELEEDDRDKFSDQLSCIGVLGRKVAEHSVPLLTKLLEDRITRLRGHMERLQQQRLATGSTDNDTSMLSVLFEDLHWLILITGYVLAEEAEGETPMIPADIMDYSINQAKATDINTTLKVLGSPQERVDNIPGADQTSDTVVRLIAAVFRLCDVENRAADVKMSDCLSPQVASSIMWFLRRWSLSYLLPDENYYSQRISLNHTLHGAVTEEIVQGVSLALQTAFGRDTDGAQWTINFLLQKILSNLTIWSSEEALMNDTMQLLVALVDNRGRASFVTKTELLWNLAKDDANQHPPFNILPSSAKRHLSKAMVMAGPSLQDDNLREEFWQCVLLAIQHRFYSVICQEDFSKKCHNAAVKGDIVNMLESLIGMALGSRPDNLQKLYQFFVPMMEESIKLLDLYHNYEDVIPLILEFFSEVVNKQLCYLGENKSRKLYELCLSAIQVYSKHNAGKKIAVDVSEEEECKYNDILIVMELLINLLSKDFIDFGEAEEGEPQGGGQVSAAEVVLYGLNTLIPIMNTELLKFPALCSEYFKLITFLGEVHPEKFYSLPEDMFKSLMMSVESGLTSYGPDITKKCFEILTSLASNVFQTNQSGSYMHSTLAHFLKMVFRMLLLESFDMDLLEVASCTLFCLICCHQDQYRDLVNQLLDTQGASEYKERLLEAFNNLTPPSLHLTINRQNKIAFMKNFDEFLINVRGFLCVK